MYNLNKLAWTAPSPSDSAAAQPSGQEGSPLLAVSGPPPAAGWSVTPLQDNKLLVMGGHTKVGKVCLSLRISAHARAGGGNRQVLQLRT
jgi:hypothetical protein